MYSSVVEWLEKTSAEKPDNIALVDENEKLTFKQYHDKAVGIADTIIATGCSKKKPIVVYLKKSVRVLTSFMGIAYAGCFYSPIDVDMPQSRVNKILEVLEPGLVITSAELKEKFAEFDYTGDYLIYEEIAEKEQSDAVAERVANTIDTDLLYVLFTSGSTGTPKGVCITHRGVLDYTDWVTETFDITEKDRFGNQASDETIAAVELSGMTIDYETSTLGLSLVFRTEAGTDYSYVLPVSTGQG